MKLETVEAMPLLPVSAQFPRESLEQIAQNGAALFKWLKPTVTARCPELAGSENTGTPAAGVVANLRTDDSGLVGDLVDVPAWAAGLIRSGDASEVRCQVYEDGAPPEGLPPKAAAGIRGPVLRTVLIVGGPCVRSLADLVTAAEKFTEQKPMKLRHVGAGYLSSSIVRVDSMCCKLADEKPAGNGPAGNQERHDLIRRLVEFGLSGEALFANRSVPVEFLREAVAQLEARAPNGPASVVEASMTRELDLLDRALTKMYAEYYRERGRPLCNHADVIMNERRRFSEMKRANPSLTARQYLRPGRR